MDPNVDQKPNGGSGAARPRSAARCSTTSSPRATRTRTSCPVEQARANFEALFEGLRPGEDVASTADHEIPVARRHDPGALVPADRRARPRPRRLLPRRRLAARLASSRTTRSAARSRTPPAASSLNVGYRCAPEAKFPIAVDDAWAATTLGRGARRRARRRRGPDGRRGRLAPAATWPRSWRQLARDAGGPALRFQLLVYPVTIADIDTGFDMTYEGYFLYRDEILWHYEPLLHVAATTRRDPRVSPLLRRRARPAAGADPVGRVRPAPPAGGAVPRPPAGGRRRRRLPRLRRA